MADGPDIPQGWTEAERWCWQQIEAGKAADFNARDRQRNPRAKDLDPKEAAGWDPSRRLLSVSFLQTVLTEKSFVDATPFQGVQIIGALVGKAGGASLDLAFAHLNHLFWLERSRVLVSIHCRGLRAMRGLLLSRCYINGNIAMERARIDDLLSLAFGLYEGDVSLIGAEVTGQLDLSGSTFKRGVNLNGAKVAGQLDMTGSTFKGDIAMESVAVGQSLFTSRGATFEGDVILRDAKVAGQLDMTGSTFKGGVAMDSLTVGQSLYMSGGATFEGDVNLNAGKVDGQLVMTGSTFKGDIAMDSVAVGQSLFMSRGATFEGDVRLTDAKVGGSLTMSGSTLKGGIAMDNLDVGQSLYMSGGATFEGDVSLVAAKVGGELIMSGSPFKGNIAMDSLAVGQSLFMSRGATFEGDVNLNAGKVDGQLDLSGSTFEGTLKMCGAKVGSQLNMDGSTFKRSVIMESVDVEHSLLMSKGATFESDVLLLSAKVGTQLNMIGSNFKRAVFMENLYVQQNLFMRGGATFEGDISLITAVVGSNLDISDAKFSSVLDLTGCDIRGELRLGSAAHLPVHWEPKARLLLRNAHVGALQDRWKDHKENSWPGTVQLGGFTYERLGGFRGEGEEADMLARPVECYLDWLEREPTFSPQPYEQLAKVFREAGHSGKAQDILYAGRVRARRQARIDRDWLRWTGMWLLQLTIGYGLGTRYFRALFWVFGVTVIGVLVLIAVLPDDQRDLFRLAFASFDQILPIVELNKGHSELIASPPLPQWALAWFYMQKLTGFLLGSFIVAGIAGLTQKS